MWLKVEFSHLFKLDSLDNTPLNLLPSALFDVSKNSW